MKKLISTILSAAMLMATFVAPVNAEDEKTTLYYGGASVDVIEDPTGTGKGNVFYVNGYETSRGYDIEKGNNPYIEIPNSYLYDLADGKYKLKNDFSISFDMYTKTYGFRYCFYTGSDDYQGSPANGTYGMYLIPDTGSGNYIEGLIVDEWMMKTFPAEYTPLKQTWHNIEIAREGTTYTVYLDGEKWIEALDSPYDYISERVPNIRIGYTPYTADGGASAYIDNIVIKNGDKEVYNDSADGEYNIVEGSKSAMPETREIIVNELPDADGNLALIDASYNNAPRRMDYLDRGLVAVNAGDYGFISWRWLGTESAQTMYKLYKNGEVVSVSENTSFIDYTAKPGDKYSVEAVGGEKCEEVTYNENSYYEIKLDTPQGGTVTLSDGKEESFTYSANDAAVGDVDGDGVYEIILKWEPSNNRDSSHLGATGNTLIDAYKLDGTKLWRIDLGVNVRSGPHDTQFVVGDFNLDGKAEVAMRTADGTIAGDGTVIGDGEKDWRDANGKNLQGPLFMTVFNGETGAIIDSVDYAPASQGEYDGKKWDIASWGDDWGNRSERFLAGVGYFDGERPSMLFCRGYYDRTALCAWILNDENKLEQQWLYDTYMYDDETSKPYRGQGNHSLAIADVDYDGKDEVIYGAMNLDNDGTPMYSLRYGHGDAQHVTDLVPSRPGLEVFSVYEGGSQGFSMRDARTGEVLWTIKRGSTDVGRGASADVDPYYEGAESWSSDEKLVAADGTLITTQYSAPANFLVYWDGDLGREVQDSVNIYKWNHFTNKVETIFTADGCHSNNAAKSNPTLTADILGDWREEVIYPTEDNSALRIFTTTIPTAYKLPTLMHDARYNAQVAAQNICYNQPTHVGYNLSYTTTSVPVPNIEVNGITNPDLSKKTWSLDELYAGDKVAMVINTNKAFVNGATKLIDSMNADVVPFIRSDRTMVPIRFISEAFGAHVEWNEATREVTVINPSTEIKLAIDKADYTVNGEAKTMDVPAFIENDRTYIPLRAVAEGLGYNVYWNDGAIVISVKELTVDDAWREYLYKTVEEAKTPAVKTAGGVAKGEKFVAAQGTLLSAKATFDGIEKATDCDFDTYVDAKGRQIIQLELEYPTAVSALSIAFADGESHNFRVFTKWSLDSYDADLENMDGWAKAIYTQRFGTSNDAELYIFPVPKYGQFVKIVLDPTNSGDTAQITEVAAVLVK